MCRSSVKFFFSDEKKMGGKQTKPTPVVQTGPISSFQLDLSKYAGEWIEVGRYAQSDESTCNDVKLTLSQDVGGYDVVRVCGCHSQGNQVWGTTTSLKYNRVGASSTFEIPGRNTIGIIWTDYVKWSFVADRGGHFWIYRRPGEKLTGVDLNELHTLVEQYHYIPDRVILTEKSVKDLASQEIYTGTIPNVSCLTPESKIQA
jgi:hypothetical protein